MKDPMRAWVVAAWLLGALAITAVAQERAPEPVIALVGARLIDGSGRSRGANAAVLIKGQRIKAVRSAAEVRVSDGVRRSFSS